MVGTVSYLFEWNLLVKRCKSVVHNITSMRICRLCSEFTGRTCAPSERRFQCLERLVLAFSVSLGPRRWLCELRVWLMKRGEGGTNALLDAKIESERAMQLSSFADLPRRGRFWPWENVYPRWPKKEGARLVVVDYSNDNDTKFCLRRKS